MNEQLKEMLGIRIYLGNLKTNADFVYLSFSYLDPICQIAVDNTRQTLYGRTQKGSIQVTIF